MTFNRYIASRMVVELIGAIACATQLFNDSSMFGLIATVSVAMFWVAGEIWVVLVFRRENPRSDELSDQHQLLSTRFAFITLVIILMVLGFANLLSGLLLRTYVMATPMILPTLAMLALTIADARYLWLEHQGDTGEDDE
ncbi:hypothetical protein BW13_11440 [Bifidobacterium sp. UTCIF-37]|uniref:hypothetical protein n=1 Tax=unclassified Bifidobacterium TaxID=2608897 RepID=UPI001129B1B9|nr:MULTISPECIES: hypothetical protein [unclassified Bifidobacterium]TPF85329.1 hypothetical protein BW13_11440 [Bifidobacterium sp. UTCIF-37]TPF87289.1 hypothetical protein BW11_11285 [Bifidobacterium sp. UTCIF-38]